MQKFLTRTVAAIGSCLLVAQGASAAEVIVFQTDFEDFNVGWSTNPADPHANIVHGPNNDDDFGPAVTATRTNPTYGGVTETIFASANTRYETYGKVTERNWDIHDGADNCYVAGYRNCGSHQNHNMAGYMLGHTDENYGSNTANYYQLDNINLAGVDDAELRFDFDSWIQDKDLEGFAVAYSGNGGSTWGLLTPSTDLANYSEMQYDGDVACCSTEQGVANLTGQDPNGVIYRFHGSGFGADPNDENGAGAALPPGASNDYGATMDSMAGTAIFDLSNVGHNVISLRFVFASDGDSTVAEGINIDNVIVTGNDDPGGGNNVPEPFSLGLALAGIAVAGRRKIFGKKKAA